MLRLALVAALAALGLSACVVVPAYPRGHVHVRPAPPVYVAPYPGYYYHHRHHRRW